MLCEELCPPGSCPESPSSPPLPFQIFHGEKILGDHEVTFLDIAFDEVPERYYRSIEVNGPFAAGRCCWLSGVWSLPGVSTACGASFWLASSLL